MVGPGKANGVEVLGLDLLHNGWQSRDLKPGNHKVGRFAAVPSRGVQPHAVSIAVYDKLPSGVQRESRLRGSSESAGAKRQERQERNEHEMTARKTAGRCTIQIVHTGIVEHTVLGWTVRFRSEKQVAALRSLHLFAERTERRHAV